MFCSKCGKQIIDQAVFCYFCGAKVEIPAAPAQQTSNGFSTNTNENGDFIPEMAGPVSSAQPNGAQMNGGQQPGTWQPNGSQQPNTWQQNGGQQPNTWQQNGAQQPTWQQNGAQQPNTWQQNGGQVSGGQPDATQTDLQGTVLEALVGLRTGKGLSMFSMMNSGKIRVSSSGVEYSNTLMGKSANNHSYSFLDVADTKFSMTHAGLQPLFGYTVTLKNGTQYVYTYSPVQKNKMHSIDATIRSQIRM